MKNKIRKLKELAHVEREQKNDRKEKKKHYAFMRKSKSEEIGKYMLKNE